VTAPIRILGAGPAGLTAAICLARAGRRVQVHERRSDVGLRFPGDLQGLENWSCDEDALSEIRRYGISPDFEAIRCAHLEMIAGRERFEVDAGDAGWYLVRRGNADGALDSTLRRQAESLDVDIRFGATLPPEEVDIVATGPRLGEVVGVGKGIVFETSGADTSVLLLDPLIARSGYAYLLIAAGRGVLACGIFDAFTRIDEYFEAARNRLTALREFDIRNPRTFGGVEAFSPRPRWHHGRALVVGEASGVQDLLWGFGIRTAVRSGWLAARSIIEGTDYGRAAATALIPGVRATVVARAVWELSGRKNFEPTLRFLRSRPEPVKVVRLLYTWTRGHALVYPLAVRMLGRRYSHFSAGSAES
jgi:flavin-dependent dehydrogenase